MPLHMCGFIKESFKKEDFVPPFPRNLMELRERITEAFVAFTRYKLIRVGNELWTRLLTYQKEHPYIFANKEKEG
ncbi:hypothetical protein NPIL_60541 [Nephila pilipes]|uniref:Uncharacterized protein n=1 Tax=Nephila pilipes TaxID=299642 RepID=A0A8X6Q8Z2_NEPPI|nr:hypothetical protein NPIL_60541 [Nephila pilipes]